MRVLLIGKGGREHALAYKIARSPLLTKLYLWPGNPAMHGLGEAVDLAPDAGFDQLVAASRSLGIDLVVSGPEAPLSLGLADAFEAAGIPTFGPRKAAAQLEASKVFAKDVMQRAGIPTAGHRLARNEAECRTLALATLEDQGGAVLKASGLAAGKGVFVCTTQAEVDEGLRHLYHTDMQAAAGTVVIEDVLKGRECSYFTFIGEGGPTGLGFAVDFKRLEDLDKGPNTGGMGCYAPVAWLPADAESRVVETVVEPLLRTLAKDGVPYRGFLYVGIMWSPERGPQVVEFNVRLGDPEAQVLAAYDDRDWLAVIAAKCGKPVPDAALAAATSPITHDERAVCVVLAAKSYPFGSDAGDAAELPVSLFANQTGRQIRIFAASVAKAGDGAVRTATGRVLSVTARARSYGAARDLAYAKVSEITAAWRGARWRTDIAKRIASEADT